MKRKTISKKLRFEVFERNNFTCQYCGRTPQADNCTLQVDHIISVKNGGTNNISNLITSCWECNIGKGSKILKLPVVPDKEKEYNNTKERLDQILALNKWQQKINNIQHKISTVKYDSIRDYLETKSEDCSTKIKKAFDKNVGTMDIHTFRECLNIVEIKDFEYTEDYMKFLNGVLKQKRLEIENPKLAQYTKEKNFLVYEICNFFEDSNKTMIYEFIDKYGLETTREAFKDSYSWISFKNNLKSI